MIQIEKDTERVNWKKIKAEYLAGDISYRKLADKYGVSIDTLERRAKREEWVNERKETYGKITAKARQKIVEKTAETMADNAAIAADIKRSLLLRLQRIEQKYPFDATEVRARQDKNVVIYRIRDLTAAYRELTADIPTEDGASLLASADDMLVRIRETTGGDNGGGAGYFTNENKTP